jgi:hypothetical protein
MPAPASRKWWLPLVKLLLIVAVVCAVLVYAYFQIVGAMFSGYEHGPL